MKEVNIGLLCDRLMMKEENYITIGYIACDDYYCFNFETESGLCFGIDISIEDIPFND